MVRHHAAEGEKVIAGKSKKAMASTGDAGVAPTGRLAISTYRRTDLPTPTLPTPLHVAHAPDGAHGVEARWLVVRVEANVLVRVPEMRFPGKEIFNLERFPRFQTPLRQWQM